MVLESSVNQAWFDRRFKKHILSTRVVGTCFNQDGE